jgi:tRNA(fMet)-specific endonuclease VapC
MNNRSYLLDTCMLGYLAEVRRGAESPEGKAVEEHLKTIPEARLFICPVIVGEVEYGLQVAPDPDPDKQEKARRITSEFVCLPIDADVARDQYGQLRAAIFQHVAPRAKREKKLVPKRVEELVNPTTSKELGIQENDLWIASVAISHNLILVTNDAMNVIRTHAGVPLQIENWCKP